MFFWRPTLSLQLDHMRPPMIALISMTQHQPLVIRSLEGMVRLEMPISEFAHLVMYVLTTGDLIPDDPRPKLIEEIKKRLPIWKRERSTDGTTWVEGQAASERF